MKTLNSTILIFIGLILNSCGYEIYYKQLNDKAFLIAPDLMEQMMVFGENNSFFIEQAVFAVGYNEDFLIAMQHPLKQESYDIIKNITFFYVVNLKNPDYHPKKLTFNEYLNLRKEWNVPNSLYFTIIFDELK